MTFRSFIQGRPTDHPLRGPLRVCSSPAEARIAALGSVRTHCGDCNQSWPGHAIPAHDCRDHAGRDNGPAKLARAEGARRELRALRNLAGNPPCPGCGQAMPVAGVHTCAGREPLPHELAAAQWQRQGTAALLSEELAEVQKGTR